MEAADWHTFQILTKRSSLMVDLRDRYGASKAPSHIWLGVSVEDAKNAVRLKHLGAAQASVRFISFEPLLGSVGKIDLEGIDWLSQAVRAVRTHALWQKNGRSKSEISADRLKSPSSSSSGAALGRNPADACFGAANGINILRFLKKCIWRQQDRREKL